MRVRSFIVIIMTIAALAAACSKSEQTTMEQRSQTVMPFDLNKTMHMFQDTSTGGVQTVMANQPDDRNQIALIRAHLKKEANAFQSGDFSDPAYIHTQAMPGLATLESNASRIAVTYQDVPAGGTITYQTKDATLVKAIHVWFAAQVKEHGKHAMMMGT